MKKIITVLGGDRRSAFAADFLRGKGHSVFTHGVGVAFTEAWREDVAGSDCVLLPIPVSEDGVRIRCDVGRGLRADSLAEALPSGTLVLGGRLSPLWREILARGGAIPVDYADSEFFQARNAVPTVEGALLLALEAMEKTLFGSSACVLGYGRIASLLCERLYAMGAEVTVVARREEALAHAEQRGYRVCRTELTSMKKICADVVFNTVPQVIVCDEVLKAWGRDCLLVELASAPGGFDLSAVRERGMRRLHGNALPGRFFPCSAGEILARTAEELIMKHFSMDKEEN